MRFICIVNNNNTVIEGQEEPIALILPEIGCEDYFTSNLNATHFTDLEDGALAQGIRLQIVEN